MIARPSFLTRHARVRVLFWAIMALFALEVLAFVFI